MTRRYTNARLPYLTLPYLTLPYLMQAKAMAAGNYETPFTRAGAIL